MTFDCAFCQNRKHGHWMLRRLPRKFIS